MRSDKTNDILWVDQHSGALRPSKSHNTHPNKHMVDRTGSIHELGAHSWAASTTRGMGF